MLLIVFAVFLFVVIAVFAAAGLFEAKNAHAKLIRERLSVIDSVAERRPSEELALLRDELVSEIPALNRLLSRSHRISALQKRLSQAEIKMRAGKFLLLSMCMGLFALYVAYMWTRSFLLALIFAALAGGIPFFYASFRRARRFRKFEREFPEAIDLLGRAVRAGHTFTTALELIGTELNQPVGGEFQKLFEEQKFGLPLTDALINLADRVPLIDVKFFVTAVMLQRETGGNLAEILDKLSYVIRERFKILRQVQVYTAQGRITMMLLMALPPGLVVIISFMNPSFIRPLFMDPIGHFLIAAGITLQTMGFFIIRKIIHIRV